MGSVKILDCTLRDGGYINNWCFGQGAIQYILKKLDFAGIDLIEIGFIKKCQYDPNYAIYPDVETINSVIPRDSKKSVFVGMVDMSNPVPLSCIPPHIEGGIDAIRVIFKQDRIDEGYEYVKDIIAKGYLAMVQLVSTDTYADDELVEVIKKFNKLNPYAVYIVDSLGLLKRKDFLRMVYLVDHNLSDNICLGYHSHNNLQQARGNAESMVELGLKRDIIIDACVFGMGRGAGNLNEELFADYLNENYDTNYRIEPMLEIIDEYLNDIYKNNFWGYSLPFYLSAKNRVHPNYAKYYNEKGTLTEKAFNELLKTIKFEDSHIFSRELADKYYIEYMENYVDDRGAFSELIAAVNKRPVLIIAPGVNYKRQLSQVTNVISDKNPLIISIAFLPEEFKIDYVFCSNLRKYEKIKNNNCDMLLTSNLKTNNGSTLVFNYNSYLSEHSSIFDNSGLMLLKILHAAGIQEILVAGMDGYDHTSDEICPELYSSTKCLAKRRNKEMSEEIKQLQKDTSIIFITNSLYV